MIIFSSFNYVALLHSTLANVSVSEPGVGHHGGRGTMAAIMVHCVFVVYKHGWCLLCYKCTDSYMKKGGQLKLRKFSFFVAGSVV